MLDKVLALFSMVAMFLFFAILIWYVPEIDLAIISIIVLAMAIVDFFLLTSRNKNNGDKAPEE